MIAELQLTLKLRSRCRRNLGRPTGGGLKIIRSPPDRKGFNREQSATLGVLLMITIRGQHGTKWVF